MRPDIEAAIAQDERAERLGYKASREGRLARYALAQEARVKELEMALSGLYELCLHANRHAFDNGVTDYAGAIDEGDMRASRLIDAARAALKEPQP